MAKRKLENEEGKTNTDEVDASEGMNILQGTSATKKGRKNGVKNEADVDLNNALAGLLSVSDTMRRLDKKNKTGTNEKRVKRKRWARVAQVLDYN